MMVFYVIVTVFGAAFFITDLVLRYMEKISNFGFDRPLFRFKGETIPYENFFPLNLTMLFAEITVFGMFGILFAALGLKMYFSLPCSFFTAMVFCYFVQSGLKNYIDRERGKTPPRGMEASGIEGFVVEPISDLMYGVIEFEYNGVTFQKNAVSANESYLEVFERVIIVLEENDVYFVESIKEVFDVLSEN